MIAHALEVDPALLPFMPELLTDFAALGSDPDDIVDALRDAKLPHGAVVYDLGCGKGAVSVAAAKSLGVTVVGFDLFEPFIEPCRAAAVEAGVAAHCSFRRANILDLPGAVAPADAVVFGALGDVLGPLDETMAVLRLLVKPGGVILISDSYLKPGAQPRFPDFEGYAERAEMLRRLQVHGDVVERAIVGDDEEDDEAVEMNELAALTARARALATRRPDLVELLDAFVQSQAAEYAYMAESLVDVIWVVRRAAE